MTTDPRPAAIASALGAFAVEMAMPAPMMLDCPACGGSGEHYVASDSAPGYDGPFGACGTCGGSGSVPAMCEMPGCKRPATMTADGQLWCDDCGHPDEDHTTTGQMAALAIETIRATETN